MSVKSVAVRLLAEGGRQVRAEFESVGEAAEKSFGGTGREVEKANRQLEQFAQRARLAAAAAAAALVAAGAAAVRSGLQSVDAAAKLAASLDTTVESVQVLERAGTLAGISLGQVEQASLQLTRRLAQAAAGTGPAVQALQRLNLTAQELQALPLDERVARIQDAIRDFIPAAEQAAVASQIFGDRAGLIFSRIDSDVLRTAAQDVRDFGVAVSDVDARQIERTNDALSRLGLVWRGLANQLAVAVAPALEAVADGLAAVARVTGPVGQAIALLIDNLGRLVAYAGTVAAFFAGRFALSMVAAAASVIRVTTALTTLRALMARTLPGILILAVGELVARLTGLAGAAADAERAIDNLSLALNDELRALDRLAPALAAGTTMSVEAARTKLQEARARHENIAAIIAETRALAMQTGEFKSIETDISNVMMRISALQNRGVDGGQFAPQANRADIEYLMSQLQDLAAQRGSLLAPSGAEQAALAETERQIERLTAAIEGATGGVVTMGGEFGEVVVLSERLAEGVERAGGAARGGARAAEELADAMEEAEEAAQGLERAMNALEEYGANGMDLMGNLADSIVGAFRQAESAVGDFVRTGKLEVKDLVRSIIADFAQIAARRFIFAPLANALAGLFGGMATAGAGAMVPSFDGGGSTGHGARTGGLDGRGGFLAMMHPQEEVIDRTRPGASRDGAPVYVTITTRDAESFRQSRSQVTADIARAVQLGRRGL